MRAVIPHVLTLSLPNQVYYAIVPMLQDNRQSGHGDFSYFLQSFASREHAAGGHAPTESSNLKKAEIKLIMGTVFSLKTSPEVSKSRTHKMSADSLNEIRAWLLAFETVPDVVVSWEDAEGNELSKEIDQAGQSVEQP